MTEIGENHLPTARSILLALLALSPLLAPVPAPAQQVIGTVGVGTSPIAVAINPVTNTICVANTGADHSVTVINGITDTIQTVTVGFAPNAVAVNSVTNKIYVTNGASNTVTVIDGAALTTSSVTVGLLPVAVAVNAVTNKIYVVNESAKSVTVIDGVTLGTTTVPVGTNPDTVAVNSTTNKIYVGNYLDNSISVIDGASNSTLTIANVLNPFAIGVNALTNKLYVADFTPANKVTVIDGATNSIVTTIPAGMQPNAVGVNAVSNKVYVTNENSNDVTVIDGATNQGTQVPILNGPYSLAVDGVTNQIYITDAGSNAVTMLDGVTDSTTNIAVGTQPQAIAVNAVSNRIYAGNYTANTVSVIAGAGTHPVQFVAVPPCRLVDTRPQHGGGGPIQGGTFQSFALPQEGTCGSVIPPNVAAYSLNVTVIPSGQLGYLTIWPTGEDQPIVSLMNSLDGRVKANATIVPAGYQGEVSVYVTDTTNVVIDIDGYFAPQGGSTLQFYPLTPCRVVDTRKPDGPFGGPAMQGGMARQFPMEQSTCNIPNTSQAYSLNFTVVPKNGHPVGYLSTWPVGQNQPTVSTLNDVTGTIVANAAIVPAGNDQSGSIWAYTTDTTDMLIDIDGYFAPAGTGGLSLYPTAPCRVLDTRVQHGGNGAFNGELMPPLQVLGTANNPSPCGLSGGPGQAQALVLNATVIPQPTLGYLTLWPDGEQQPLVSTLNAIDGAITSNMAVVPNSTEGKIDAFANGLTQLLLDISSYFAP